MTFDLAEEIAEISAFEADVIDDVMRRLETPTLAPAIRLAKVNGALKPHIDKLAKSSEQVKSALEAIAGKNRRTTSLDPLPWEVVRIPVTGGDTDPFWQAFVRRLRRGSCAAGISHETSNTFAHAMVELAENIIEHSEHPETGVAFYETLNSRFEFGVADSGVGILSSLKRNSRYAYLCDDLDAIRKSIEDGVSRFDGQGRGWGFRTIFRALRNSNSEAMLRSGTAGLQVHPRMSAHDRIGFQRGAYQGLWVSVSSPTTSG